MPGKNDLPEIGRRRKRREKSSAGILTIPPRRGIISPPCGCSLVVKRQLPKLELGVRFPPSAGKAPQTDNSLRSFYGFDPSAAAAAGGQTKKSAKSTVPYPEQWIYVWLDAGLPALILHFVMAQNVGSPLVRRDRRRCPRGLRLLLPPRRGLLRLRTLSGLPPRGARGNPR